MLCCESISLSLAAVLAIVIPLDEHIPAPVQQDMTKLVKEAKPEDVVPSVTDAHLDQSFLGSDPSNDPMGSRPRQVRD